MLHFCDTVSPLFEASIFTYKTGERFEIETTFSGVLFILEGNIHIHYMQAEDPFASAGQLFLLPPGSRFFINVHSEVRILIVQIPDMESLCLHFLSAETYKKRILFDKMLFSLPINKFVTILFKNIENYILSGMVHSELLQIKSMELFHFLTRLYSEDSLARFFAPLLSQDYIFTRFVMTNYSSVKTVEELAKRSHYSLSGFEKQFRKVFGIAPYKWMMNKKAEKIYYEIYETTKPLKVIAEEYGFAGLSQLSDFCRKRLGASPVMIRNKKHT